MYPGAVYQCWAAAKVGTSPTGRARWRGEGSRCDRLTSLCASGQTQVTHHRTHTESTAIFGRSRTIRHCLWFAFAPTMVRRGYRRGILGESRGIAGNVGQGLRRRSPLCDKGFLAISRSSGEDSAQIRSLIL